MVECDKCGEWFPNVYQLGPHKRVCITSWDHTSDDNCSFTASSTSDDNPDVNDSSNGAESIRSDVSDSSDDASTGPTYLWQLAQRQRHTKGVVTAVRVLNPLRHQVNPHMTKNLVPMQQLWNSHVQAVHNLCSKQFWSLFNVVNTEKGACADAVLKWTKKMLQSQPVVTVPLGHSWPSSRRSLRDRINRKAGLFWDNVTIATRINMGKYAHLFNAKVSFNFVDPLFVWLRQANRLIKKGYKLEFDAKILRHPTSGAEMYGSGVQYGWLMRSAKQSMPAGGKGAFMNLSWDSGFTGYSGRSSAPICLQVMNCNSAPEISLGLLGYVPHLETSDGWLDTDELRDAKFHLLQECVAAIVRVIEAHAENGFKGVLGDEEFLFFPRLGGMTLDTPERTKYFGLQNMRSCGFCRLRNGRSLARLSRRQDKHLILLLMGWSTREAHTKVEISQRAKARAKLKRHGWNYKRRCRLMDVAQHCLVDTPQFPNTPFSGLCHYERMHTFFINFCTYLLEILSELVPKENINLVHERVRRCHQFRDPFSGHTFPRLTSVLKMTHLTAERRVRAVFYWAHVLGTSADVIIPAMRTHAPVAVSTLQLVLIAVRGHRAYTSAELNVIFHEVAAEFFKSLEILSQFLENKRMRTGQEAHEKNPDNTRPPVPFKRQKRYICSCVNKFVFLSPNMFFKRTNLFLFLSNLFPKQQICFHVYQICFQNNKFVFAFIKCVFKTTNFFSLKSLVRHAGVNPRLKTRCLRTTIALGAVVASTNIPKSLCRMQFCTIPN